MTGSVLFVLIDRLLDHKCETKNVLQDHFKIKITAGVKKQQQHICGIAAK